MDPTTSFTSAHGLKNQEITLLKKGNIQTVADLVLTPIQDIAKRCKSSPVEIKRIVDTVLNRTPVPKLQRLDEYPTRAETFTTGSEVLDGMLGGGLRTGMVWEVVGESAAGKTQFALQSSLFIQLPPESGGMNGSACYLTTSSKLPTTRLLQIAQTNDRLAVASCSLEHVHTLATPTVSILQHVLTTTLPSFIKDQKSKPCGKPIKLLVIDALGELFHSSDKTTTSTLVARSKDLANISAILHDIAADHQLAVLVLNEVIDIFDQPSGRVTGDQQGLSYDYQSRWFNSAEFFGEKKKEASLGLVWANQVNTRIMLSRTGRRKYIDLEELSKRARLSNNSEISEQPTAQSEEPQSTLIRRFSVIFSNVCLPFSLDYIVTEGGILVLPDQESQQIRSGNDLFITWTSSVDSPSAESREQATRCRTDDIYFVPHPEALPAAESGTSLTKVLGDEDNDDRLWSNTDAYDNLDWDALEQTLSQAPIAGNHVPSSTTVDTLYFATDEPS